jgi:hypothetical protein
MPLDDLELDEIDDEVAHCHPAQSVSYVRARQLGSAKRQRIGQNLFNY